MARTGNAVKNSIFGIISKIVSLLLNFILRTVFIYFLNETYLGINGLYTEILSMLSFIELGFGTSIIFAMYKPIAENDETQLIKLLGFYKTTYIIIACVVSAIGLGLLPFLQYIVKGADNLSLFELRLYFVIFLSNTILSYFVAYKSSYVNALQKNYIITNYDAIVNLVIISAQVVILAIFKNFLAYLLAHTLLLAASKIILAIYLNHKFPILKKKATVKLTAQEKKPIFNEVKGLAVHQFASVAVHSTDNIIISTLSGLGVVAVGLVSNYNLIIQAVTSFILVLFTSVIPGFGDMVASSSKENYHNTFLELNFLNFWLYGFCVIAFFVLIPPFITLWIGKGFLIDQISFILILANCYLQGQSTIYNNARIASGNFNKDKWWALAQALVNLVVSIIAAKYLGLVGVYIGTVVSRLVYIIFRPYSTYKFLFDVSSAEYYKKLVSYIFLVLIAAVITWVSTKFLFANISWLTFIIACGIVVVVPNIIFLIFTFKTKEFKMMLKRIRTLLHKESKNVE